MGDSHKPHIVNPPAGVADVMAVAAAWQGAELCALGYHAWTPWLQLPNGSYVTFCSRCSYVTFCSRCKHDEGYDL